MTTLDRTVKVGTRTSPLSLAQTEEVAAPLRARWPGVEFIIVPINTHGDRNKSAPLLSMARGMFVKEIEQALLDGEIDLAVHSAKDLPSTIPDGLVLAAFGQRRDPRDVLVTRSGLPLGNLPAGARLGTSSPRRQALIKSIRPDVETVPVRGNVGTRMDKAFSDDYDGVVLAAAGIERLGRGPQITEYLPPETFIPDAGQGALAVEARASDASIVRMLMEIDHKPTSIAVRSERAFLHAIGGGCKVPVAAYATLAEGRLHIRVMAGLPDGSRIFRAEAAGRPRSPESVGRQAARKLMESGASEIIGRGSQP